MADVTATTTHRAPGNSLDAEAAAYGVGWKIFTALMLFFSAAFTLIFSVIAAFDADWFRTSTVVPADARLPTESTLHTWGWIGIVVGFVVILAGFGVFWGTTWARAIGVGASVLNILLHLRLSSIYPWWSVAAVTLNFMVIFGLIMRVRPLTPEQQATLEGRVRPTDT